jgi:uncharacterized protein with NRDE domain
VCLILVAVECHPHYKLILAANRDEYLDRETAQANFWDDSPGVLAGKDLRGGGTWMGVTLDGRICALTNYRDPAAKKDGAPSRGMLVSRFLLGREEPVDFFESVSRVGVRYSGFNLLAGIGSDLYWLSNRSGSGVEKIIPGVHGLSNGFLDTPWPKVLRGNAGMARRISGKEEPSMDDLFHIMEDRTRPPDSELPDTGIGLEWERTLSSMFIQNPTYGTRSTTLLFLDRRNKIRFIERTHDISFKGSRDVLFEFGI